MSEIAYDFSGFSLSEQKAFAKLSGDFNPAHLDKIYARRSIWGNIVVHGINQVLFILNHFFRAKNGKFTLTELRVEFFKPLQVDCDFKISLTDREQVVAELVSSEGIKYTKFYFSYQELDISLEVDVEKDFNKQDPEKFNLKDLEDFSCEEVLGINKKLLNEIYPHLASKLSLSQIALLTATTRVVGMKCPGQNSIFSELNLKFRTESNLRPTALFEVESIHKVFKLVRLNISGVGGSGFIKSFLRPEPYRQASLEDLEKQVKADQFIGEKALVVGGSRGIGEVAVKLLAIGGAEVTLTYNSGKKEAEILVEALRAVGYKVNAIHLDVLDKDLRLDSVYSTVYYFASPFIFSGVKDRFNLESFSTFSNFYINAFVRLVQFLQSGNLKKVFYPSSTALDELVNGMWEYSATKAAAEHICDLLEKRYQNLFIYKPRLPRVKTDQTQTLMPIKSLAPEEVLKDLFIKFQAMER